MKDYCQTHPSYQAKREPRSKCAMCLALYTRERLIRDAMHTAATTIAELLPGQALSMSVELEPGYSVGRTLTRTSAFRIDVEPKPEIPR